MNSKDLGADLALAWPDAEIGIMGAEAGGRRSSTGATLAAADDPEAERDRLAAEYAEEHVSARWPRAGLRGRAGRAARHAPPAGGRAGGRSRTPGRVRQRTGEHPAVTDLRRPRRQLHRRAWSPASRAGRTRWRARSGRGTRYENLAWVGRHQRPTSSASSSTRALELRARRGDARVRRERRARVGAAGRRTPTPSRLARMFARLRARRRRLQIVSPPPIRTSRASSTCARARARGSRRACAASTRRAARVARAHGVALLEGFDHPAATERDTYADDGFHPSAEGHRRAAADVPARAAGRRRKPARRRSPGRHDDLFERTSTRCGRASAS